jgi:hypothetical protein
VASTGHPVNIDDGPNPLRRTVLRVWSVMSLHERIFTFDMLRLSRAFITLTVLAVTSEALIEWFLAAGWLRQGSLSYYCIISAAAVLKVCDTLMFLAIVVRHTLVFIIELFAAKETGDRKPAARLTLCSIFEKVRENQEPLWIVASGAALSYWPISAGVSAGLIDFSRGYLETALQCFVLGLWGVAYSHGCAWALEKAKPHLKNVARALTRK